LREKRFKLLILSKYDLRTGAMAYVPLGGELFIVGAIALFLMWLLFAVRPLPGP
jgi:hypothetical protein